MTSGHFIYKTCNVLNNHVNIIIQLSATSVKVIQVTVTAILTLTAICINAGTIITIWKTPVLREKLSDLENWKRRARTRGHGQTDTDRRTRTRKTDSYGKDGSVNLSLGCKNEFYPLQRGFRSFVNSAWISRGFCVDTNKC